MTLTSRRRSVPKHVRDAVFERDGYSCQMCGHTQEMTLQHRYGGHGRPETVDSLLALCLWCNIDIEADVYTRREADRRGLRLRRWESSSKPVIDFAGRVWVLTPEGGRLPC